MSKAPTPTTFIERAERVGRAAENLILVAVVTGMIVLAASQIVMRNLVGEGLGWADEALRVMVLWVALLGAVAASREDRHLCVDVLSHYLPNSVRQWLAAVVDAFTSLVCLALAWLSAMFVADSFRSGERLIGVVPAWTLQVVLPVAFLLIAWRYAIWVLRRPRLAATAGRQS